MGDRGLRKAKSRCVRVRTLYHTVPPTQSHPRQAFRPEEDGWGGPIQSLDGPGRRPSCLASRKRRPGLVGWRGQVMEVMGGTSLDQPPEWGVKAELERDRSSGMAWLTLNERNRAPYACLPACLYSFVHLLTHARDVGGYCLETPEPTEVWAVRHLPFLYHDA